MADSERALEAWVRGSLTEAYGAATDERVPEDWISLIEGKPQD